MKRNRWALSLIGAAALLLVSCSEANTPTGANPASSLAGTGQLAYSVGDDNGAEHHRLTERLREIRDSLKDEREQHHEEFKQAREAWKDFQRDWKHNKQLGSVDLLACAPQEYTAAAELIGPNGGSIKVGPHELRIPAGALDHEVVISAVAPVSTKVEVQLQPEGLQFAVPARLKLSYSQCVQPPSWLKLFIVYLGANDQVLDIPVSRDKKGLKEVVGYLEHFSRYAVAW